MNHLIQNRPSNAKSVAETLYATGFRALSEGFSKEAQKCFALMAGVAPFDARPWVGLGASFEQQGNWKGALGMYTFGRSVNPTSLHCKLGEARMLAKTGEYHAAQNVLDTAEAHANLAEEVQLVERLRGEL
jgi:Flp pilus assembly protein TadD